MAGITGSVGVALGTIAAGYMSKVRIAGHDAEAGVYRCQVTGSALAAVAVCPGGCYDSGSAFTVGVASRCTGCAVPDCSGGGTTERDVTDAVNMISITGNGCAIANCCSMTHITGHNLTNTRRANMTKMRIGRKIIETGYYTIMALDASTCTIDYRSAHTGGPSHSLGLRQSRGTVAVAVHV